MDEIGKLKEQLLDTQQAKIDGELRLLSDKRQLLKELQSIKVSEAMAVTVKVYVVIDWIRLCAGAPRR